MIKPRTCTGPEDPESSGPGSGIAGGRIIVIVWNIRTIVIGFVGSIGDMLGNFRNWVVVLISKIEAFQAILRNIMDAVNYFIRYWQWES